jgi:outer membrane protein assembly factor BamB
MAATFAGTRQILVFSDALVSHDATSGRVLWSFPWPTSHAHVAMPVVVSKETVLISSGYGTGSALLKIERDGAGKWSASTVWRFNRMKAKFANLVLKDGCIYGFDDGIMACLDARSGELKWKDGRYGHGQMILVGDLLLATAETGEVILLDPKPDKLRELSRFSALQGKTWNPPALAGELLLLRNDTDAVCFRLSVKP